MKKKIAMLLTLCLLALLCACGETAQPETPAAVSEQTQEPEQTQEQVQEQAENLPEASSPAGQSAEDAPAEQSGKAQQPAADAEEPTKLELALTFVDKDVAELIAAVGEPVQTAYEASCSGPGDDGVWSYDGFTVFTYRENGVETVVDAE